jgi:hypothetical protein
MMESEDVSKGIGIRWAELSGVGDRFPMAFSVLVFNNKEWTGFA